MIEIPIGEAYALREWRVGDEESLARYANNRNVWRNLRDVFPHPYTPTDARAWISLNQGAPPALNLAIATADEAVGGIGATVGTDVASRSAEVGYWLGEPFWGQGIMTAAVRAFVPYVFDSLPQVVRLHAEVFEWNPASARVLEKVGFVLEGRCRQAIFKDGELIDALAFSLARP